MILNCVLIAKDRMMAGRGMPWRILVAAVPVLVLCGPASAQVILNETTAGRNLDLALANAPGDMVTAGVARARETARRGFEQVLNPQITDPEDGDDDPTPEPLLRSLVDDVVEELTRVVMVLLNRWLARAGLMDLLEPSDLVPEGGTEFTGLDDLNLLNLFGLPGDITPPDTTPPDTTPADTTPPDPRDRDPKGGR